MHTSVQTLAQIAFSYQNTIPTCLPKSQPKKYSLLTFHTTLSQKNISPVNHVTSKSIHPPNQHSHSHSFTFFMQYTLQLIYICIKHKIHTNPFSFSTSTHLKKLHHTASQHLHNPTSLHNKNYPIFICAISHSLKPFSYLYSIPIAKHKRTNIFSNFFRECVRTYYHDHTVPCTHVQI